MKSKLMFPLVFVALVGVACGGDGVRRGEPKSYETVQEGSAAGVTATLQGPGEVLPPITGTNADTTTAFTIDPNAVSTAPAPMQPPAGTTPAIPPPQTPEVPAPAPPEPKPAPEPEPETAPPTQTDTVAPEQEPEEEQEEEEPPPPPTTTDTRAPREEPVVQMRA